MTFQTPAHHRFNFKRFFSAIVITLAVHFILIFLLGLIKKPSAKKETEKVIEVYLSDIVPEKTTLKGEKEENPRQNDSPNLTRQEKTKTTESRKSSSKTESNNSQEKSSTSKNTISSEDIILKYEKEQQEKEAKMRSEFSDNTSKSESNNDSPDNLDEAISRSKNRKQSESNSTTESKSRGTENGINWSGGESRKLQKSLEIKPPENNRDPGLNHFIRIEFKVEESGLVSNAIAVSSSLDAEAQIEILQQFKNQAIFDRADFVSYGEIMIYIQFK